MWWQALLTLIGGLIVVLAVPMDVRCQAGSTEVPPLRVRVRWLFGLLRLERALPGPSTTRAGTATPPARRPPGKGARVRFARIGRLALVERVLRLLGKLLRRISILHLEGRLRIGLDDPADTGILLGALLPLHALLRPHMRNGFTVAPEFAGECFEADADFEIRVVPLRLIGPAASFAAWFGVQAWRARGQRRLALDNAACGAESDAAVAHRPLGTVRQAWENNKMSDTEGARSGGETLITGAPTAEERQWAMFAHLAALIGFIIPFGNIIGPLVVWQMKKNEMPFVDDQGKEALNFQITVLIAVIVSAALVLVLIGLLLLPLVAILALVFTVIGGIRANNGEQYRYPLALRLIT